MLMVIIVVVFIIILDCQAILSRFNVCLCLQVPTADAVFTDDFSGLQVSNTGVRQTSQSCPGDITQPVRRGGRQRQEMPPLMTDEQARIWQKERHKKDSHNMSKS